MRADQIEPGDVLTDPQTGALIYTVVRPLPDHWRRSVGVGEGIAVLVRYEVDGGTDVRTFAADQDVPLTRTRPIPGREGANPCAEVADDPEAHGQRPARPSTLEERRAARAALRRAEERAAEAQDRLHRLRTRATRPGEDAADPVEIAAAEAVYREACQAEDDAALVVDRLDRTRLTEARAEPDPRYPIPSYGMDAPTERGHIGWQDDRSTP